MLLQELIANTDFVEYSFPVQQCLSKMLETNRDFVCVTDDRGTYLGTVDIYKLIGLNAAVPLSEAAVPLAKPPAVVSTIADDELLQAAGASNSDYLIVIDDDGKYRGILNVREVLAWGMSSHCPARSATGQVLDHLGYGYLVVSPAGTVRGHLQTFKMLGLSTEMPVPAVDLPGSYYIGRALEAGLFYSNIEIEHQGNTLVLSTYPAAAGTGDILVIYGDVDRNYHLAVLKTVFDSIREGVNIVDEHGVITYCNPSSARYINQLPDNMIGKHISNFYPRSTLLAVIQQHEPAYDVRLINEGQIFLVNAVPFFLAGAFKGGISIFREITEITQLTTKLAFAQEQIDSMQLELNTIIHSEIFNPLIGAEHSLKPALEKARRCIASLGGPRHCIISGETGTGKTTLAKAMYEFAKKIKVIGPDAPFIEVNCAQFTNSDIAAMEIFGSEKGSFTGALEKKGLVEVASGGVLFLDEAHALDNYQTMLLRVIENGVVRRIGGRVDKKVEIIFIAASSRNLREALNPELYQRLAQYQIDLLPLYQRSAAEKRMMMQCFCRQYEQEARSHYGIELKLTISPRAEELLLSAQYPRNIRQFRDVVYAAIDNTVPLISHARNHEGPLLAVVDVAQLPNDVYENRPSEIKAAEKSRKSEEGLRNSKIIALYEQGLGPRKIANKLKAEGIAVEYYQIAYRLKKLKAN